MMKEIRALAEKRQKWVEANRENGFESGLNRLLTDLYPDNAHFIYELLQNAEDAHAKEVGFILHKDRVEFEHNGQRLFSIEDVDAITSIGFSTKRDDATKIGKFGVGFKAVFAYTNSPEVDSGGFHFRIRNMVVPEPGGLSASRFRNGQTRFVMPFDNPKKPPANALREIETLFRALGATTLLFLTHIRKITYALPDAQLGYIERFDHPHNMFEICVQPPNELAPTSSQYLKFEKDVAIQDHEATSENEQTISCRIAVAFGLKPVDVKVGANQRKVDGKDLTRDWELVAMEPGRVCIYFPADKETSNLRFHLHAPFASTVARDSVRDCAGNNMLRNHLADLLAESMHSVRDQGLLTVQALSVLPNNKDNLSGFYLPLMNRLVAEFREQSLVPMKRGGHAEAEGIVRGAKALSDLIDDDDLVTLLGDHFCPPMWAANPSQRNQREDSFLSMLPIWQWDVGDLVEALGSLDDGTLGQWMGTKDGQWHHSLYEVLLEFIHAAPKNPKTATAVREASIKRLALVRCGDDLYRIGSECFFPTVEVEHDARFPRVATSIYFANKEANKKTHEFLEMIGVREVNEKVEIELILKERYSQEAIDGKQFRPELNDMARFIAYSEKHPSDVLLFRGHYVFKREDGKWGHSGQVYLDAPFVDTGLRAYYMAPEAQDNKKQLSADYEKLDIEAAKIGKFATLLGATCQINIVQRCIPSDHPSYRQLIDHGGWSRSYGKNKDYYSEELSRLCKLHNVQASRLIWKTMSEYSASYLFACYRSNSQHPLKTAYSSFVFQLRESAWVPQRTEKTIEFVQPRDAVAERLPDGFAFQTDWEWLKAITFGSRAKERLEVERWTREKETSEYQQKKEAARYIGFDSPEEAEEIARLTKENPEEFKRWKERVSNRKERPTFPSRPTANPERRQQRLGEQLSDAPNKEYEKRERSVRTTSSAIDASTWLRNQYTNEADQMVCQICKKEMPFRKRDGAHYFEKKEVLSRKYLPKEHEAQYLALCPLCAAMYEEFVKSDDDVMADLREKLVTTMDCDVPITLGDQNVSIRFVESHYQDIKSILEGFG